MKKRDASALESLVRPELPHAVAWARRLGYSAADADDAVQDALTRLVRCTNTSPISLGVRAWLCREVRTRARTRRRSETRRRARERVAAERRARNTPEPRTRFKLEDALAKLSNSGREALELRFRHDLEYAAIAEILGLSEGACRQRVHKALSRLRGRFGDRTPALLALAPLPVVHDGGAFVHAALASATVADTAVAGGLIMATTTGQKITLTAALAFAVGIGGTLAVQRAGVGEDDSLRSKGALQTASAEVLAERDAEIARLRKQLEERGPLLRPGITKPGAKKSKPRSRTPATSAREVVSTQGEAWRKAILQSIDVQQRETAWAEVRAALKGEDRLLALAALHAVRFTPYADVDRVGLVRDVERHVDADDGVQKLYGWWAVFSLHQASKRSGDILEIDVPKLLSHVAVSPLSTRGSMVANLVSVTNWEIDGDVADLMLRLMDDRDTIAETLRGMGSAKRISPKVRDRVFQYAREGRDEMALAAKWVLRGLEEKDSETVRFLLDAAESGSGEALDALRKGVGAADAASASARLRDLFERSEDVTIRRRIVNAVGDLGDEGSREWLTRLSEDLSDRATAFGARIALRRLDQIATGSKGRRRR